MKLLANAMDYWSSGALKALFLEHEVGNTCTGKREKISVSYSHVKWCEWKLAMIMGSTLFKWGPAVSLIIVNM